MRCAQPRQAACLLGVLTVCLLGAGCATGHPAGTGSSPVRHSSTAPTPSTSPSPDLARLDSVDTDGAPLAVAAVLPSAVSDPYAASGLVLRPVRSGSPAPCSSVATDPLQSVLSQARCPRAYEEIIADKSAGIALLLAVLPLRTRAQAAAVGARLDSTPDAYLAILDELPTAVRPHVQRLDFQSDHQQIGRYVILTETFYLDGRALQPRDPVLATAQGAAIEATTQLIDRRASTH